VAGGSLFGRLVFIDGTLAVTRVPCPAPGDGRGGPCVLLSVPGLGLPVLPEAEALPWRGEPPAGAWIVAVARDGRLGYLGSLVPDRPAADDATELTARLLGEGLRSPGSLLELQGWLVADPVRPWATPAGPDATPGPTAPPFLAADEPRADGTLVSNRGGDVELAEPVIDVDPGDALTGGTFLVAPPAECDLRDPGAGCRADMRWTVVARYDPARSVRVLVP
jgi:hypothetical protein